MCDLLTYRSCARLVSTEEMQLCVPIEHIDYCLTMWAAVKHLDGHDNKTEGKDIFGT